MGASQKLTDLAALHASQWLPPAALERLQLRRLRRVLAQAARLPIYREGFAAAGLRSGAIGSLAQLAHVPTLSREALVQAYPEGALTRPPAERDVVFRTSGSSGQRMEVAYSARANDYLDAVYARALFATGYRPWHRIAYFWWEAEPRPRRLYEQLGLMRKQFLPLDPDPHRQLHVLRAMRPRWIYSFPSSMMQLARLVRREGLGDLAPEGVICHGELMPEGIAEAIGEAFACPVWNQYGAQEFNRIGWTCAEHGAMHLDAESVLLEIVDEEDRPCAPGSEGAVVLTGLVNELMPLVRYRVGDVGRIVPGPCPCGRGLPRFELTEGRADDVLELADGRRIGPRVIAPRIERLEGFTQYRLIQHAADRFVLRYVPEGEFREGEARERLERGLREVLDGLLGPITLELEPVAEIRLNRRGKLQKIVAAG